MISVIIHTFGRVVTAFKDVGWSVFCPNVVFHRVWVIYILVERFYLYLFFLVFQFCELLEIFGQTTPICRINTFFQRPQIWISSHMTVFWTRSSTYRNIWQKLIIRIDLKLIFSSRAWINIHIIAVENLWLNIVIYLLNLINRLIEFPFFKTQLITSFLLNLVLKYIRQ